MGLWSGEYNGHCHENRFYYTPFFSSADTGYGICPYFEIKVKY